MKIKSLIFILILLPTLLYGRNALPKVTYNNMEFIDVADDNAVEPFFVLNRYLGADNKVIVPDSIMCKGTNYAVKGIAQLAFLGSRDFLKEVYLPNSVTYINEDVFSGCRKLEYVKLPEKLSSVG
ncbi:MAG: leucine-rich repeat domain-containing protein, partial [Muribaculaceae bacterium]|nr:leucine-rich repeat domain-containing protein [Muribaculaceae bacterium]